MLSTLGKARGLSLRLALVLEMMWWCSADGIDPPPAEISLRAFVAAAHLLDDYFMPIAARVYGDAATSRQDRNAATLAQWIVQNKPDEVHVRHLQREARLRRRRRFGRIGEERGKIVGALGGDARQRRFADDAPGIVALALDFEDVIDALRALTVPGEDVPNIFDRRAVLGSWHRGNTTNGLQVFQSRNRC